MTFYTPLQDSDRLLQSSVCLLYIGLSVFSFPDDNLSKCQWIFTKFVCALKLWRSGLGLPMGKFPQFITGLFAHCTIMVGYYRFTFLFVLSKRESGLLMDMC